MLRKVMWGLIVAAMLGVLGGCAGHNVNPLAGSYGEHVVRGQNGQGTPELYLWLKNSGDKWVFDDILNTHPKEPSREGVAVAVSSLESVRLNKSANVVVTCTPILTLSGACTYGGQGVRYTFDKILRGGINLSFGPFYQSSLNKGTTLLLNTFGLAMTMGMAVGSYETTYVYDDEAYRKALQEAVGTSGFTPERRAAIFRDYEAITAVYHKALESLKLEHAVVKSRYGQAVTLELVTKDESGFWTQADDTAIKISTQAPPLAAPESLLVAPESLPFIGRYFANFGRNADSLIAEVLGAYAVQAEKLRKDWALPKQFTFSCSYNDSYHVTIDCPSPKTYSDQPIRVIVPVTVHSKKEYQLYFPWMAKADENVRVTVGKEGVVAENLTGAFLTVDVISLYWNGRIATNSDVKIELPPHGAMRSPYALREFDLTYLEGAQSFVLRDVTRKKLADTHVRAGFAMKYRVIDQNITKTVYVEKPFAGAEWAAR